MNNLTARSVAALAFCWLLGDQCQFVCAAEPAPRLESLAELENPPPSRRSVNIHGWKSAAGGRVLFVRTTELPIFDLHVSFAAGSRLDGATPGLAASTFSLINEGVPGKDLAQILEAFDDLGARFNMNIDPDRASLSLRSLATSEKREPALRLFTQLLGEPGLSEAALVRVKHELHLQLKAQQQDPDRRVTQAMKDLLLPGHPYAQPLYGTATGLDSLTHADVLAFHRHAYSAANAQITLVGDLTLEQAQAISLQMLKALPGGAQTAPLTPITHQANGAAAQHIERPSSQMQIMLGQLGVTRQHPDYLALKVAHMIFGGEYLTSRLMTELREKRGLTYVAQIKAAVWEGESPTAIRLKTSPPFSDATVALVKSMYRDFVREGPTQQELDRAIVQLRSNAAMNSASNAQILAQLVEINQHGLPLDLDFSVERARTLTVADLKAALNRHFDPDQWALVTLGPTVEQQPLPPLPNTGSPSMCRADSAIVAS